MKFSNFPDYKSMSKAAADLAFRRLTESSKCFMGLASGHSPTLTYQLIAGYLKKQSEQRRKILGVQIDEWQGLQGDDISSCQSYIQKYVIEAWQLLENQCIKIDGMPANENDQVIRIKSYLENHPMDLCILGLGTNGHLALNEPGSLETDTFRTVDLDISSQRHNMLLASDKIINRGITIGLKEILKSKEILLLITGNRKKEAYDKLVKKVSYLEFPATILYEHDNCHCLVDEEAIC